MSDLDLIYIVGGTALILLSALLSHLYTRSVMMRSITRLARSVREIGAGNLTVMLKEEGSADEKRLGEFHAAINEMTGRLINTVSKLSYSAGNIDKMAGDIYRETDELKAMAREQKAFSDQVALSVEGVRQSIQEIYESIESLKMAASEGLGGLTELNEDAELMTTSIAELKSLVDRSISSVVDMSSYVSEGARSLLALQGYGQKTVSSVQEIEGAIREIEGNTEEAGATTEKVFGDAKEGSKVVERTVEGIEASREIIVSSSRIMEEVGSRSEKIGEVIDIISGIADRTKLLALNASIIAAEAGEYGRGFAVVADEIEKLSNMTSSSTGEIREIVKGLQSWAGKGIDSMRDGLSSIDESVALARTSGKTLERILESSRKAAGATGEIVKSTREQTRGVAKALESIQAITSMIARISDAAQKEAAHTGDINALMQDMRNLMERVNEAAEKRTITSVMLAESYDSIQEMLHHITEASKRQHGRGEEIVLGAKKIRTASGINADSSEKLSRLVKPLKDLSAILKDEVQSFKI